MCIEFPRGAEWRKWDLHFHTPSSYDYKDKSITNDNIIKTLLKNDISVVAITDHHIMDLERIRNLQEIGKDNITVLPGIEILSGTLGKDPVHFIGIFSENCKLKYIWEQLKNNTGIKHIEGEGRKNNEIYCDLIKTSELIHKLGGIVTIHAGKKNNSIENITHALAHGQAQKEDTAKAVDMFELGSEKDVAEYKDIVVKYLKSKISKIHPLLLCSDNHNINNYSIKQNLWVKADPTFEGLKQVINEPEARVFVGDKPPLIERISTHRTKYIKELSIKQVDDYNGSQGIWFNNITIPFNSELVAIIGNKGSGKSAIADILSLCSNYYDDKNFSFLTSHKFREKSGKIAKNFKAKLTWESEIADEKNLNDFPENTEVLKVKYLPQGKFERLTNEISSVENFQKEIESVVFSHIPESERLGASTFNELIEKKSSTVESQLETLKIDIKDINKTIVELERKSTKSYRAEIENKIKKKREELTALVEPKQISDPNKDPDKQQQNESINKKINKLKDEITKVENDISETESKKKKTLEALEKLKKVKIEIQLKEKEISRFISEKKEDLLVFGINVDKLISIKTDFTELEIQISGKEKELIDIRVLLGESQGDDNVKSLSYKLKGKQSILKIETSKLNTEQKMYQDYLTAKATWEKEKAKIIGDIYTIDTLKSYEKELNYLDKDLSENLNNNYEKRREIVRDIFDQKQEIIAVYKDARNRLNEIIRANSETLKDYKISVDASLVKRNDFNDKFLGFIDKGKAGTFYSKDGGESHLITLLGAIDFDKKEDVICLLDNIVDALRNDKRTGQNEDQREVADQVKDIPAFYNYLFSLEFLENNYQLKQGDKELEQLSPGERGALLLVFYLLLDKNDIPLIIDQPEDNLDNHSVATVLVPFIRAAKKKRQIIMVTHNPNLAIVSDAEQVIYVNLDKKDKNTFSTISGSIENKTVNHQIVEVLEGAMPAFTTRARKYYKQKRIKAEV